MRLQLSAAQLVLAALCCVLGMTLLYLWFAPLPEYTVAGIKPPAIPADTMTSDSFDPPPRQAFAQIDNRSVFNPLRTRVNGGPVSPTGGGATNLPSDLTLVGVILDGDTRLALIKSPTAPLAVGISVGGTIEGWQLSRVDPDKIVLRSGGTEQELKMTSTRSTPMQFQAAPPPPQPAQDSSDKDSDNE